MGAAPVLYRGGGSGSTAGEIVTGFVGRSPLSPSSCEFSAWATCSVTTTSDDAISLSLTR